MSGFSRLLRGETKIDFVGLRRRWYAVSAVLLVLSVLSLGVRRLDLGIEFVGGVAVQAENPAGAELADIRQALTEIGLGAARIQLIDDGAAIRVETETLDDARRNQLTAVVAELTGTPADDLSLRAVGPSFGGLVARQAVIALVVFLGAVALFISWRLQWKMAATGLVALVHDLVVVAGIYSITGFKVTPATVVALLTILGYSLYDTVVVFDKVEELEHDLADKATYSQIVNRSMNQVLVRSLNTSLTSLLPVGSLLFVGSIAFGASSLQDFALALFVGIGSGTYSSVFVAAPLLAEWKEREPVWIEQRERLERKEAGIKPEPRRAVESKPFKFSAPPTAPRPPGGGRTPRPPKKGRR